MESKAVRLDMYGNTDEQGRYLDPKYSLVTSFYNLPGSYSRAVKIERFVTLVNGNQILPPNPLVDITVLFQMISSDQDETTYYYTSLSNFLQENYFINSYLQHYITTAANEDSGELQRILIQYLLRFIPPQVFNDDCSKLMIDNIGMIRAYESIYTGHFYLSMMTPEFKDKFQDFCKFFRFKPIQSLQNPENQGKKKVQFIWENLGVPNLDQVIHAFMMPAFLKHPQILEAASILSKAGQTQYPNFIDLHKAIDFTERGFGYYDPTKTAKPIFWKSNYPISDASFGQTLLIYYKPIETDSRSNRESIVQSITLFAIPKNLINGENNITILDKEFFRRKVRKHSELSTGYFINYMQLHIFQLLNHMSFEDAHFQAYLVTNPQKGFDILALESDDVTIEKIATFIDKTMKEFYKDKQIRFYYTMYTFRNFHYKDLEGETKLNEYLQKLTTEALGQERNLDLKNKFIQEYPYPGMDPKTVVDSSLIYAPPRRNSNTPDHLYEADDPIPDETLGEGEETPVTFTKAKLVAKLSQAMVETCYDYIKLDFQEKLVVTHEKKKYQPQPK